MPQVTAYDAVNWEQIPRDAQYIHVYYNGAYAVAKDTVAKMFPRATLLNIDVNASAPAECSILDIERYDANPADLPGWCRRRWAAHPGAICRPYCNLSTWPAAKDYARELTTEEQNLLRWWTADPTGAPHINEGAAATQYRWAGQFDITLAEQNWFYGT